MKLDLRPRCKRCGKMPRGKMQTENYERYKPYCSYHCQEWANLEGAQRYINENLRHNVKIEGSPLVGDPSRMEGSTT